MSYHDELMQAAFDRLIEFQLRAQPFQTPESEARARQREQERQAKLEMAYAEAHGEWEDVFRRTNDVGRVVLGIHTPGNGYDGAVCADCMGSDGYEPCSVGWPCATFLAVKEAL